MNVRDRLEQLMNQQGISAYKLSQDSGVSWNTIHNILKKDINPTVQTLEKLCKGFGISLVQFFDVEGAAPQISAEQQRHLNKREMLCERDRRIIDSMIDSMLNDKQSMKFVQTALYRRMEIHRYIGGLYRPRIE